VEFNTGKVTCLITGITRIDPKRCPLSCEELMGLIIQHKGYRMLRDQRAGPQQGRHLRAHGEAKACPNIAKNDSYFARLFSECFIDASHIVIQRLALVLDRKNAILIKVRLTGIRLQSQMRLTCGGKTSFNDIF